MINTNYAAGAPGFKAAAAPKFRGDDKGYTPGTQAAVDQLKKLMEEAANQNKPGVGGWGYEDLTRPVPGLNLIPESQLEKPEHPPVRPTTLGGKIAAAGNKLYLQTKLFALNLGLGKMLEQRDELAGHGLVRKLAEGRKILPWRQGKAEDLKFELAELNEKVNARLDKVSAVEDELVRKYGEDSVYLMGFDLR